MARPGHEGLIAEGRAIKVGRRLAILEVTIFSESDRDPVAHATGTYSIPPEPAPDAEHRASTD